MLADGLQLEKVYVDETGFNLWIKRTYGKARVRERVNRRVGGQRGRNVTVIAAISDKVGIMYHKIHCTSVTNDCFNGFVRTLEQFLIGRNAVIILDKAPVHNQMADIYPELTFKYLPPYSPFLNPIENCFSVFKAHLKPFLNERADKCTTVQARQQGTTICALRETLKGPIHDSDFQSQPRCAVRSRLRLLLMVYPYMQRPICSIFLS